MQMTSRTTARPALSRRAALKLLASGAGLSVLAACSPSLPTPPPAPDAPARSAPTLGSTPQVQANPAATTQAQPKPAATTQAQPKLGGTLRFATGTEPANFDVHQVAAAQFDGLFQVFDMLIAYDGDLTAKPRLAESWDVSPDYRQFKFNLRKGVQFHSGREFTSDDVQWNLLRVRDPKANSPFSIFSNWINSIETPDKSTVILKTDQPRPPLFDMLAWLCMMDRDQLEGPDAATKAIGTGPFKLAEYRQGQSLRLVKNASYWESGKPYLDELNFTYTPDRQAALVQLEAGSIDVLVFPPFRDAVRLQQDPKYRVLSNAATSGQAQVVFINTTLPPGDSKNVRQAINFAIDRQRIADTVFLNQNGPPRDLPWPAHSPAYDAAKNSFYTFDLDKARSLLKESGVDALEMDSTFRSNNEEAEPISQIIQADLAKIGVKVNIRKLDPGAYLAAVRPPTYRGISPGLGGYGAMDPVSHFTFSPYFGVNAQLTGFKSDTLSQLVNQTATEPDSAKRKQLYAQLNDVFLDESVAMILSANASRIVARAAVQDIRWRFNEVPVWAETWLG
jgi:peptide/nickel transport system substrate-binding protein